MTFHQQLKDVIEDQLCLASIHYLRSHYQEAIDIYKRILLDNRWDQHGRSGSQTQRGADRPAREGTGLLLLNVVFVLKRKKKTGGCSK